jgi:hypothetical protein
LQNRAGIICASTGCAVSASARATIAYSRTFRRAAITRPRTVDLLEIAISSIESHRGSEPPDRHCARSAGH